MSHLIIATAFRPVREAPGGGRIAPWALVLSGLGGGSTQPTAGMVWTCPHRAGPVASQPSAVRSVSPARHPQGQQQPPVASSPDLPAFLRHDHQRQSHVPGYRPPGRGFPAHGVACPARQPDGQRRNPRAHPAHRPRAELQGRQERLQPAPAQCRHAGPAVLRRPDQRRLADQPVLPLDAGLDHPRLRAAWAGPAGVLPAAVHRLAGRLRGQQQGRWHHPAGLRRLPPVARPPAATGRTGHAFRALGRGPARPAGCVNRQRQLPGRA